MKYKLVTYVKVENDMDDFSEAMENLRQHQLLNPDEPCQVEQFDDDGNLLRIFD